MWLLRQRQNPGGNSGGTDTHTLLIPKTLEEHRAYLHEIVCLKLWFLWGWLREHPEEAFAHVLRERVDIYRKLDLNAEGLNPRTLQWDDPSWLALEARAEQLYQAHRDDALAFEEEAFALFQPHLDARAPRDFADRSGIDGYTYGSIRFDPPGAQEPTRVSIHIANTIAPHSIFADPTYLPNCLLEVMARAEQAHGANALDTFTWLNSHPRWLALFTTEWQKHLSPPNQDILWHYGFWGQFINARGAFNARLAQQFRTTGCLPYPPRGSWCSFAALRRHLAGMLVEVS